MGQLIPGELLTYALQLVACFATVLTTLLALMFAPR